ncbi:NAD(P)-binding protein [Teratosphaeria nubilosa]|uniref:NAD(P)-binding protein n=1 Tax=Teratosphaeria nubilosa TaxID=161662 RepID=A0A6G1KYB3_9PEZI|nr:NAD(P)-binding protein [Teratosphaeria nubilosa]
MGILGKTVLNPFLTAPLWLLLTVAPDNVKEPLLAQLRQHVSAETIVKAITALKWLTILGGASLVNSAMNVWAYNNFRIRSEKSRYYWPKEVAVVSGAAGGFGRLICKNLSANGVNVVALDIVDSLPKDMQQDAKITYYKLDVTDHEAIQDLAVRIKQTHGTVSVLVNNAGIAAKDMGLLTVTPETLRKIYDVNLISHYYMLQAFLPDMIAANKGHVVTTASMSSFVSPPAMAPYATTKNALVSLQETMMQEVRVIHQAPAIKFTIVHPTFADTGIITQWKNQLQAAKMLILRPEVVADAVVKQILSCRSGQIILPEGMTFLAGMRGWSHWLMQSALRLSEQGTPKAFEEHMKNLQSA